MSSEPSSSDLARAFSNKEVDVLEPSGDASDGASDEDDVPRRGRSAQHISESGRQRSRKHHHAPRRTLSLSTADASCLQELEIGSNRTFGGDSVATEVKRTFRKSRRQEAERMQRSLTPKSIPRQKPLFTQLFDPEAHLRALREAQHRMKQTEYLRTEFESDETAYQPLNPRKTMSLGGEQEQVTGSCNVVSTVSAD